MINFLNGKIIEINDQSATILVNGVGYEVFINSLDSLNYKVGDEIGIYTYLQIRENDVALYGFIENLEKRVFNLLIGVSGVGPKSAMAILANASAKKILDYIYNEDEKALATFPGLGKKTAARVVLELKEKVANQFMDELVKKSIGDKDTDVVMSTSVSYVDDLRDALLALGYHVTEINHVLEQDFIKEEIQLDTALRKSLQFLTNLRS